MSSFANKSLREQTQIYVSDELFRTKFTSKWNIVLRLKTLTSKNVKVFLSPFLIKAIYSKIKTHGS